MNAVAKEIGDLETLMPSGVSVSLSTGETFTVTEFKFGQLGTALKHLKPVLDYIGTLSASQTEVPISELAMAAPDAVYGLIGLAIKKDRAWFDDLATDDGFKLAQAVVEVNKHFFLQRVRPLLATLMPRAPLATATPVPTGQD